MKKSFLSKSIIVPPVVGLFFSLFSFGYNEGFYFSLMSFKLQKVLSSYFFPSNSLVHILVLSLMVIFSIFISKAKKIHFVIINILILISEIIRFISYLTLIVNNYGLGPIEWFKSTHLLLTVSVLILLLCFSLKKSKLFNVVIILGALFAVIYLIIESYIFFSIALYPINLGFIFYYISIYFFIILCAAILKQRQQ